MDHIAQFIQNHWQLSLAFVVITSLIFINEYLSMKKQGKSVSPEQAIDLINHQNAIILDIRDAAAFKSGHIINSIRAAEADFNSTKMDKYKNKTTIIVCTRGIQAANLAKNLRTKGFTESMVLSGGIDAWKAAGLPLIKK